MPYASQADITAMYGAEFLSRIADVDSEPGPDCAVVTAALSRAAARIDAYLAARFALPIAGAAPELLQPCIDIAVYYIANDHLRLTEEIAARYADSMVFLRDIAAGKATVRSAAATVPTQGAFTPSSTRLML